jgi:methionyl-tRNA synthetase
VLTEFEKWWPPLHLIGKDIMIPAHGVYWPIMLKALGFTDDEIPPLLVHGWWNIAGAKMSKSLGNIVDPDVLADKYGVEALRYYLMSDIATGRDADFSEERLVQRYNTDLANSLGNLLNRTLSMAQKYRQGKLAARVLNPTAVKAHVDSSRAAMDEFRVHQGLESALAIAVECNQLIDVEKPWALAKDSAKAERLDAVLYQLAESLRIIAILISPVLPKAAAGIFAQLNWSGPMMLSEAVWGRLPDGHQLGTPTPLFPRIEMAAE